MLFSIDLRFKKTIMFVFEIFNAIFLRQIMYLIYLIQHWQFCTSYQYFHVYKNICIISMMNEINERMKSSLFDALQISLIYRTNNLEPRIEPCGTSHVTLCKPDFIPLMIDILMSL